MTNKNDSRWNHNKPKSQQKTHKTKTKRNTVIWESKSSIKLLYVQSQISPHLHISVQGSSTFLQEQRPEHPLSAFCEFLKRLRYTWPRHTASHKTISLLVPSPIHLDLEGSALVSMIGPKQTLFESRLWEHVASMNLVHEVSSQVVSRIK